MEIRLLEKKVPSTDGVHMLSGVVMIPEGEIRGIFQIVHGMTEYVMRYEQFMSRMADAGYIVCGYDHLGHGHTVNDKSELGFIAHKNGWKYLVDDIAVFAASMKQEYGRDLPYILFGHSMGSFVARLSAAKYDFEDKLILSGTGGPNPATKAGISVLKKIKRIKGEHFVSEKINNLIFGTYNKRFGYDDPNNWLSNIEGVRKAYADDELCNYSFTVSALEDLLRLSMESNKRRWFRSCVIKKPVLLLSGADDPVGDYGMGVKKVHDRLRDNGTDVHFILYKNCRHELLNDLCREKVTQEIIRFSEKADNQNETETMEVNRQ